MVHPELLSILCCPETHQKIALADAALLQRVNDQIAQGKVLNRARKPVKDKLEEALVREDGKVLYPVRQSVPVMLIDEAISVSQ
jgi:uncharacterized protein